MGKPKARVEQKAYIPHAVQWKPNDDGENVGAKMIADASKWLLPVMPMLLFNFN
jgi:hypothetical protein